MKTLLPFVLTASLLGVGAWTGLTGSTQAPDGDAAGTSPARAPAGSPSAAVQPEVTALQSELEQLIRRPGWKDDRWSVMVVSLDRGDTLFAHGAHDPLAPASNMKLFTTAAALYYLGPDYRWNTFLMSTGDIVDGVLTGDLIVYGTGDPTLSARFGSSLSVWNGFADSLAALGVREIRGDLIGDGSYFLGSGAAEGWQQSYMNAGYAATAGALSFTENVATLEIRPGAEAGWRPAVSLVPGGEGIAIVNQATTTASGSSQIQVARMAYDGPVVIRGRIARGSSPLVRTVPISDPARYAAAVFREVLQRRDIVVTGSLRAAETEAESPVTGRSVFAPALDTRAPVRVLAVHTSQPLMRVLEIINKRSHNLMAEQVLRTVGRVAVGDGSVDGGRRAIEYMLEQEGHASPAEISVFDGSGLSILNRSTARGFIGLLAAMAESPMWESYWETLPEAGRSDGLRRMYRTDAEGNLRAKTGTIDRVSALSGYVRAANGEHLAFSIISNNVPSTGMAKRIEDAIGARLASFTRPGAAAAGQQQPQPAQPAAPQPAAPQPAAPQPAAPQPAAQQPAAQQNQAATEPTTTARTHTVRSGDTLDGIAKRYGTTVAALQRANPGLQPRRLQLGQTVRIP